MLLNKKVILGERANPLMTLEKYSINSSAYNFKSAQKELLRYEREKAENQCTWGYFPMMEQEESYLECKKLEKQLYEKFVSQINRKLKLAFIRVASKEPKSKYGGMHLDVDIGVGHKRVNDKEIIRVLVNLSDHPRMLEYCSLSKKQLEENGIDIPHDHYSVLEIPGKFTKKIEIPPMEKDSVYLLKFCSSQIPHAGITDKRGHYLIAFGAYAN